MDPGLKQIELFMLLLGVAALALIALEWRRLGRAPHRGIIALAAGALVAAWAATNLEELLWRPFFEVIDHLGYLAFLLLVCLWCARLAPPRERGRR